MTTNSLVVSLHYEYLAQVVANTIEVVSYTMYTFVHGYYVSLFYGDEETYTRL